MNIKFLDKKAIQLLHKKSLERYGGAQGIRDEGLLESAIAMPQQAFGGVLLHPDIFSQASAYLFHICKNHPFVDGNKRTASALTFLRINSWYLKMRPNDLYELTIQVAEGHLSKEEIAKFFEEHCGMI